MFTKNVRVKNIQTRPVYMKYREIMPFTHVMHEIVLQDDTSVI